MSLILPQEEMWKDVTEYEGLYQVSTLANLELQTYNRKGEKPWD